MAKKWVQFNGKSWEEIGSGGGGGSSHTHPNLSLLNSITSAMVSAWNTAATWVSTNGANVLSHIANSLLHLPSGGSVGQVLKKPQAERNGQTRAEAVAAARLLSMPAPVKQLRLR